MLRRVETTEQNGLDGQGETATPGVDRARQQQRLAAISTSFLVSLGLMAVKFYAYRLTHSSAILSDALESIINVIASAFALASIIIAAMPPDREHPYGHGKIEYFSAGFEGALILLAALGILHTAWVRLRHPRLLVHLDLGLLLLAAAGLVNLALGIFLIQRGKRTRSLALIADGKHVLTDVSTSLGVIVGLAGLRFTGWYWMDSVVAGLVALHILFSGIQLIREAYSRLMDASDPELLDQIATLINRHRKEVWIDVHRLRAWRSGNRVHIDFHLILPATMILEEVHRQVLELEGLLSRHLGESADVLIHVDPCSDPDCPLCAYQSCGIRRWPTLCQRIWRRDTVVSDQPRERPPNERNRPEPCD